MQIEDKVFHARVSMFAYLSDLDLNRSVVLGSNQSVGSGALPGDVDVHNVSFVVLHLYLTSIRELLAIK